MEALKELSPLIICVFAITGIISTTSTIYFFWWLWMKIKNDKKPIERR